MNYVFAATLIVIGIVNISLDIKLYREHIKTLLEFDNLKAELDELKRWFEAEDAR